MDFENPDNKAQFQRRLAETIAWCASQDWAFHPRSLQTPLASPFNISGAGLRTNQFHPPEIEDNVRAIFDARYSQEKTRELLAIEREKTEQQWRQNVEQLAAKRASLVQSQNLPLRQATHPLTEGRILAYFPEETLSDGAAEVATDGFFDWDNRAAWDTWLVYLADDHLLLSWVPDSLVEVVEVGIYVNPEECIRWAADLDIPSILQLKQAGFIR